jgi:hypothetical protein
MMCAMFVGNEKDEHYSDDEIREVVTNANGGRGAPDSHQPSF